MQSYTIESEFDEYAAARERFEELILKLGSEASQSLEHGDIESLIEFDGTEVLRLLMQGHLNQRSAAEERRDAYVDSDGRVRRHCRKRCRALETLFGEVDVYRLGYSDSGLSSVFPLDAALNLPPDKYSHGVRCKVGMESAKGSFEETVEAVKENTGASIAKRQAEQVAQAASADFDEYYKSKAQEDSKDADILVMTTDGKGVVMRQEDLREATRKAAEAAQHKLKTRLSKGEKHNRKRMATVASVYETKPHQRTAEQIMKVDRQEPPPHPKILNKRVWAGLRRTPAEVIEQMFAEAQRRDPEHRKQWLVLVDGQDNQLREIYAAIERHHCEVVVIQDFIHVLEYLWKAAYCFYESGTEAVY